VNPDFVNMKINLHNHSTHSDGRLTPEEIVMAAMDAGLTHIAITDHFASAKLTVSGVDRENIAAYTAEIRDLAAKHADHIKVLAGVEIDFCPKRMDFRLLGDFSLEESIFRALDFVLLEYVGEPEWEGASLEDLIEIRPKIPGPVGLAHCHFERAFEGLMPQTVVSILEQHRIFLELCPTERNALVIPGDSDMDRDKTQQELQALHRQMETLSKKLADSPDDAYLLNLRKEISDHTETIYKRFKNVPAYRHPGRFTRELFSRLRGRNIALSIGTDTHDAADEVFLIGDAVKFLEEQMLQRNVITNFYWK
jgi:histidinol phosphatase-like PHP family hydrolase